MSDPRLYQLTALEVVAQSMLCHPDWPASTHRSYLNSECPHLHGQFTEADAAWLMEQAAARLER